MIEVLILSTTFLIIILLFNLFLTLHIKKWTHDRNEEIRNELGKMRNDIFDVKEIFRKDVKGILDNVKNILKG